MIFIIFALADLSYKPYQFIVRQFMLTLSADKGGL